MECSSLRLGIRFGRGGLQEKSVRETMGQGVLHPVKCPSGLLFDKLRWARLTPETLLHRGPPSVPSEVQSDGCGT